jgi:hypothetical protein
MDAMNALPFFLLASELDLALKASNIPAFLGLCTSSPDFRLSAELDLDAEPLRLPECLSLFLSFFPSVLASLGCLLFPSFALGLATSLLFCLLSALEPHVPDRGRGMDWVSTSSLVMVGRGWEPSSESLSSKLKSHEGAGEAHLLPLFTFWGMRVWFGAVGSSKAWSSGMTAKGWPLCLGTGETEPVDTSTTVGPPDTTVTLKRRAGVVPPVPCRGWRRHELLCDDVLAVFRP